MGQGKGQRSEASRSTGRAEMMCALHDRTRTGIHCVSGSAVHVAATTTVGSSLLPDAHRCRCGHTGVLLSPGLSLLLPLSFTFFFSF